MPRVIGIDIPGNKRLEVALTYHFRHRTDSFEPDHRKAGFG